MPEIAEKMNEVVEEYKGLEADETAVQDYSQADNMVACLIGTITRAVNAVYCGHAGMESSLERVNWFLRVLTTKLLY